MEIITRKFSFQSKLDNVPIHGICMIPEKPVAILQMVHGMSEHKGRYVSYMKSMAKKGYITLMHDNRGHGNSIIEEGDIGYCYDAKEKGFVEDIYIITKRIRKEFPKIPLVLYGHSMGSLAVRAYLQRYDDAIDGLIVAGCPGYNDALIFGKLIVKVLSLFRGVRYRSTFMQNLITADFEKKFQHEHRKGAWLAAKESVAEEFGADQLCNFTYTLNGFTTLLNLERIVYKSGSYQVKNSALPILFLSGLDDPCYINDRKWKQAVRRLLELGYYNITEIRYEGMRHEIHNEEGREKVHQDVDAFCKRIFFK